MAANNIENATYTAELNASLPQGVHSVAITDEHLTLIKSCIKNTLMGNTSDPFDTPLRVGPRALNALSDTLNLSSYVTLDTEQTITAIKTFTEWLQVNIGVRGPSGYNLVAEFNGFSALGNQEQNTVLQAPKRDDFFAAFENTIEVLLHTGNARDLLVNTFYPVGAVFMSVQPTNPSVIFPGTTWKAHAEGRYLMGVGTGTDEAGEQVTVKAGNVNLGNYNFALDPGNIPAHEHDLIQGNTSIRTKIEAEDGDATVSFGRNAEANIGTAGNTEMSTGTGEEFSISPPGVAVYTWYRTA